jgi:hypothetical protein
VGKLIGVIATVLVGFAAATGVTFAVNRAAAPDKSVNLENPAAPNNMSGSDSAAVNYGSTP